MPSSQAVQNSVTKAKEVLKLQSDFDALENELKNISKEGDRIRNELRGLIDRVKIAKVKSYIDKTQ